MASFVPFLNINTNLVPAPVQGTPSKQVLITGQRITNGTFIPAINGFTQPNYYVPLALPSFPDGKTALAYLKNYGLVSQMGINITLTLPAPTTVTTGNSLTTLTWSTIPPNFMQLTGFNLSGTLSQSSTSGQVYQASLVSGVATLVVRGTVAYITAGNSGTVLTLAGINNVDYPDPNVTDPICLLVWDFYQTTLSANTSVNGAPTAILGILSDRDNSITPSNTSITLGVPTATSVSGGVTTLSFLANTAGLGYLPTSVWGNTVVSQLVSSATGTFQGYTYDGTNVYISIGTVTGTFNTTNIVSVVLDNTINTANYLNNIELDGWVNQFPVAVANDFNVTQAAFFAGVNLINQANQILNQHFGTFGYSGNISVLPSSAATLYAANSSNYVLPTYPYIYKFGNIPYENTLGNVAGGRVSACVAYMVANGDVPYPALINVTINHLPVSLISSSSSYSTAQNGTGDIAMNQGWLPLTPNSQGIVKIINSITSLITIPNTVVQDIEFRYTHIWKCVREIKRAVAESFETLVTLPNNQGTALLSPDFIANFRTMILEDLFILQNLNVVENVELYQNLVSVTEDSVNPNQVDAYIPSQIIPQINGANILISIFSALYQFPNSQGA